VPKIAKHNAGCSLMREPSHAAAVIAADDQAVKIPVTVKMRAGWSDDERQRARTLAQMVQDAWCLCDRGPRPYGGAKLQRNRRIGTSVSRIRAASLTIPVFGSGDCLERSR